MHACARVHMCSGVVQYIVLMVCFLMLTGDVYFVWMVFVAIAFLYNAIFMPLRAAFQEEVQPEFLLPLWFFFDYVFDLVFILDILVFQSHLSYRDQGLLVVGSVGVWHCMYTNIYRR